MVTCPSPSLDPISVTRPLQPTRTSSAANRSTPYRSGPYLWPTVIMTVRHLHAQWSLLVALGADRHKPEFNDDASTNKAESGVSRPCLACR